MTEIKQTSLLRSLSFSHSPFVSLFFSLPPSPSSLSLSLSPYLSFALPFLVAFSLALFFPVSPVSISLSSFHLHFLSLFLYISFFLSLFLSLPQVEKDELSRLRPAVVQAVQSSVYRITQAFFENIKIK